MSEIVDLGLKKSHFVSLSFYVSYFISSGILAKGGPGVLFCFGIDYKVI